MDGLSFTDTPINSHGGGGEGGIEFIWSENIFQKFLDKLIVRKNGLEVGIFFQKVPRPSRESTGISLTSKGKRMKSLVHEEV